MSKFISNEELIIVILGGVLVGGFITGNTDIIKIVVSGLVGFLSKAVIDVVKK